MPELQAFRGIRYNLGRVGSLSDVVTPPYDVIGPELQEHFYQLHPNSFIRIDLNRIQPGDDDEATTVTPGPHASTSSGATRPF